jgi:hypothetical protein
VKRGALILLSLAGLSFPLGLALAVYLTAGQTLASVPAAESIASVGKPSTEPRVTRNTSETATRDRCKEREHRKDPECTGKTAPSTSSTGSSTPGSTDSSGHGSDDSSGKGLGKDDSSGHGSGSDD